MTFIPDCREDEVYNEKNLNEHDKAELFGYDYATNDILDAFFDNIGDFDFDVEGEDIDLAKIFTNHQGILDKLRQRMHDWFENERDEIIVSMIDAYEDEGA